MKKKKFIFLSERSLLGNLRLFDLIKNSVSIKNRYVSQVPDILISFFFVLLFISSCKSNSSAKLSSLEDVYVPLRSSNFKIEEEKNSGNILISVFNPWQGAKDVSSQLLLLKEGPKPEKYSGQIFEGEAQRIICMSSTHIAMLDALGATDRIVGVSGKQYVSNPKIMFSTRFIPDIGYEGNIDYETLISLQPDLVLLFSVNGASSLEPKLKELGIPFLYIGDYVEEDPLGKSEWIVPLAEVIGKRDNGIEKFKEISFKYDSLKNRVKDNLKSSGRSNLPQVMVNSPFMDSWFMPSTESYVARMIKDAGGEYIYHKNTGNSSEPIDLEEALKLVSESDFWINIGSIKTKDELIETFPKFAAADCIKEGNIYNNNLRSTPGGGNDCYESGVMNPDLILRDMVKIFHPELVEEDFVYYLKLE